MDPFTIHNLPTLGGIFILHSFGNDMVEAVMEHPEVQKFMKSGEKFDVCFLEVFHANALAVSTKTFKTYYFLKYNFS
jgi:hypothetical protein